MTGAGDLRTVCLFQQRADVTDGAGGFTTTWASDLTVQGEFRSSSGREILRNGRLENSVAAALRCRALDVASVDEGWRVTLAGVVWNIQAKMAFSQKGEWVDFILERAGKDAGI